MSLAGTFFRIVKIWFGGAKTEGSEEATQVANFARLPFREKCSAMVRFARGLWLSRKLDGKGLIRAGRRVKLVKVNGQVHVDRYCRLEDDVRIAVVGKKDRQAVLSIGYDSGIGDRTKINVTTSVIIGKGCSISWDCDIRDTNWHLVRYLDREPGPVSRPVIIGDHVWIGSHTIIQMGVTIGSNSVIAAGSVVINDIPPYSLAAGNPARVIKEIAGWDRNPDKHKPGEVYG
jgi:acetyltransferase-like isoleucine patch superfamily enzyme